MKHRINWIDIAKGLLIIGMVLNHIPNMSSLQGLNLDSVPWWITFGSAYGVFSMQSFFILSGYTSSFEQKFLHFIKKQTKGLILPYISFTLLCSCFAYIVWNTPFFYDSFGEKCFFIVDGYWFLTSLFIAKIFAFLLHRFSSNEITEVGGGIVLLIIGIAISEYYSDMPEPTHYHNWFHYRNGLCMTVFVTIGYLLRKYLIIEKFGLKFLAAYILLYCITFPMLYKHLPYSNYIAAPCYTHYFVPNLADCNGFIMIPSFLFYTISGSIMTFFICQKIRRWPWMEYVGRQSLVIYCVHFTFLRIYIECLSCMYTSGFCIAALFFIVIAILTLLSSVLVAKLFEYKPFKYFIGKY